MKKLLRIFSASIAAAICCCLMISCTSGGSGTADGSATAGGTASDTQLPASGSETSGSETSQNETSGGGDSVNPETKPLAEIRLGEANVAIGCPAISNDTGDFTNQNLTDGTQDRPFYSAGSHQSREPYRFRIDLTRSYPLTGVRVLYGKGGEARSLHSFEVYVSGDDRTYEKMTDADAIVPIDGGCEVRFTSDARYVKLISTGRSGAKIQIGEVEVLSDITNYDNILPFKRVLVMQKGAVEEMKIRAYRLGEQQGSLTYSSSDPSVVEIEVDGHITARDYGHAFLYVQDGASRTAVPVTVQKPHEGLLVSTYFLANHGANDQHVFDLLEEAGIQHLEAVRCYDAFGNSTADFLRVMAADRGLSITVADERGENHWLELSDRDIRGIAEKYRNLPGYYGVLILDEPHNANLFAPVYRALWETDPFSEPHLNLLPPTMKDYHGYVSDWAATAGPALQCLSYDHYPFQITPGSFDAGIYASMNELRKTGLQYHVRTSYYVQGMGAETGHRVPNDREMLFHVSTGLAYGMKDFKWFVWYTPIRAEGDYITGVLNRDGEKSELFDGVTAANRLITSLSPYIGQADAVEVFHNAGNQPHAPADFFVTADGTAPCILTLFVDPDSGKQYLSLVNTDFEKDQTFRLTVRDGKLKAVTDVLTSEKIAVAGGKLSVRIPAGGICVMELPEGYDGRIPHESQGQAHNLLDGIGAYASSSEGGPHFAYMANDGKRFSTAWRTAARPETAGGHNRSAWLQYDFREKQTFNRVDVYPASDGYAVSPAFPLSFSVWVSDDGNTFRKVAACEKADLLHLESLRFDPVTASGIRLAFEESGTGIDLGFIEVGEIEVYMDNGKIPDMEQPGLLPREPMPDGNLIIGNTLYVSSSYEQYGWSAASLNDGLRTGQQNGWCSQIGSQSQTPIWVLIPLGTPTVVSEVEICPSHAKWHFLKDYHVEISVDGAVFTTVASVKGDTRKDDSPRVLQFEPTEALYVRVVFDRLDEPSHENGVGYVVQIAEIALYGEAGRNPENPLAGPNFLKDSTVRVSSSYEQYGWSQRQLNDGLRQGQQNGWCSRIGSSNPRDGIWAEAKLSSVETVSRFVIYPSHAKWHFLKDYHVEVSMDGTAWTTVASVKGDDTLSAVPRILEFEPVEARFVRVVFDELDEPSYENGVGYVVQIVEIELYGPEIG